MQTKEDVLRYLLSKPVSIHYSDRKFFKKLHSMIYNSNTITTGQNNLFTKLLQKYISQIKVSLSPEELLTLPWLATVIETSTDHTSARVSIIDKKIIVKVPTNTKFISKIERSPNTTYVWNKPEKCYVSDFSTNALKFIHVLLPFYFSDIRYCDNVKSVMQHVKEYLPELIWDPLLTKINNNYYVVALNDALEKQIEHIKLNTEPSTLFELSQLGIKIHESLLTTSLHNFAADYSPKVDTNDLLNMVDWLEQLEVKTVIAGRGVNSNFSKTMSIFKPFLEKLKERNINCIHHPHLEQEQISGKVVFFSYHTVPNLSRDLELTKNIIITKFISIKNTQPIEVK